MKEKKYEKVIEWKKEPIDDLLYLGIISLGVTIILNSIFAYFLIEELSFIVLGINTSFFIVLGICLLYLGIGEGKKVYYKEIK